MDSSNEMVINLPAVSPQETNLPAVSPQETTGNVSQVESLNQHVDEISVKVDKFEQKLNEVEQFYSGSNTKQSNTPKGSSIWKEKDREKLLASFKRRQQQGAVHREATAAKRMQELMHQFATILRFITEHSWAEPFMHPVDVVGLGLHDYYEVIKKPMDFSTIKSKMEAKDGTEYKHVREICADVRLVFKNAMKYNDEKMDVHIMAKSLLDKFETKWLQLLPKVDEEEKRRKEEEAEMQFDIRVAQEAAHAKAAKELSSNLEEVEKQLRELRETVLQKCRKMSTEEKKRLGKAIARLSPEDINKAIEIVAQNDPNFQASAETVEVDIDTQSESTLWKLKFFVQDAFEKHMKNSVATAKEVATNNNQRENSNNNQNKRRREITDVLAKTSNRRTKRHPK